MIPFHNDPDEYPLKSESFPEYNLIARIASENFWAGLRRNRA
jgi:hypothetical protein